MAISKKEFKKLCSFHTYTGHKVRINAIYFDWKMGEIGNNFIGFKYMVNANVKNCGKAELFNEFYDWVTEKIAQPSWYICYKYAASDQERFKVSISM